MKDRVPRLSGARVEEFKYQTGDYCHQDEGKSQCDHEKLSVTAPRIMEPVQTGFAELMRGHNLSEPLEISSR